MVGRIRAFILGHDVVQLLTTVEGVVADINQIKSELTGFHTDIATEKAQVADAVASLGQVITSLESQVTTLQAQVAALQAQMDVAVTPAQLDEVLVSLRQLRVETQSIIEPPPPPVIEG